MLRPDKEQTMSAYLIVDVQLHEPDRYREYIAQVPAIIARHGGIYRVRGGRCDVLEGGWTPSRLVVLEFPTRDAALAFHNDPDYVPFRALRQSIADSSMILVDGC
jgi:uncharacterized protein (DUF1330 family)